MRVDTSQHALIQPPSPVLGRDARDAYSAPPGAAPFHRYLLAKRLSDPNIDTFERREVRRADQAAADPAQPTKTGLVPTLGEVLPVTPDPMIVRVEERFTQRVVPATGRVLDVIA